MKTALIYHPIFLGHDTGPQHPERAHRLNAIMVGLERAGLLERLVQIEPSEASLESIESVHSAEYVSHIEELSGRGKHFFIGMDTVGSPDTYRAARVAAGAVERAIDEVMSGNVKNAFCAVRPPGHHAEATEAMGFCFFNNVAIGARYLQRVHGIERVAIIDWDVHHGNGTQHIFEEDPSVMYLSMHQYPHYPGTGRREERGLGKGKGATVNEPMGSGSTGTDYLRALRQGLVPALRRFEPEFILVSAGFDAHETDPLSGILVSAADFGEMTSILMEAADELCSGRIVSVLEGGYDFQALSESVLVHVTALSGGHE